ncbi:uncharacterized protein [Oscarella lobularis]|uniref:uncharacterized protein n=1 Tax=Oscarella lobularis TaxID=121494 RepID=UPI0033144E3E
MGNCLTKDETNPPKRKRPENKKLLAEVDSSLRQWVIEGSVEHEPPVIEQVTFDPAYRQNQVELLDDNRTALYVGKGYSTTLMKLPNGQTRASSGFTRGRHAWSVRVDVSRCRSWMQIGVVTARRKNEGCPQIFDGKPHPFRADEIALRSDGNIVTGKRDVADTRGSERGYDTGDIISVRLDMDNRTVQWLKNGKTFQAEPEFVLYADEVYPSVSLDNPKEQVSLLSYFGTAA